MEVTTTQDRKIICRFKRGEEEMFKVATNLKDDDIAEIIYEDDYIVGIRPKQAMEHISLNLVISPDDIKAELENVE